MTTTTFTPKIWICLVDSQTDAVLYRSFDPKKIAAKKSSARYGQTITHIERLTEMEVRKRNGTHGE
jgi:hypothetical protein